MEKTNQVQKLLLSLLLVFNSAKGWSYASQSRAKFLSSSATAFLLSSSVVTGNPEECEASVFERMISGGRKETPRYLDSELQMKYGEDKGKKICKIVRKLRRVASCKLSDCP
jgi:hypothetical protein